MIMRCLSVSYRGSENCQTSLKKASSLRCRNASIDRVSSRACLNGAAIHSRYPLAIDKAGGLD